MQKLARLKACGRRLGHAWVGQSQQDQRNQDGAACPQEASGALGTTRSTGVT
jgi:hypothetical protein